MSSIESWIKWSQLDALRDKCYVYEITENSNFLKVSLQGRNDKAPTHHIIFENSAVLLRQTNESFWLNSDSPCVDAEGKFLYENIFFKIYNSKLIQWLLSEQGDNLSTVQLIHFAIVEANSYIEIVATAEPKIERI